MILARRDCWGLLRSLTLVLPFWCIERARGSGNLWQLISSLPGDENQLLSAALHCLRGSEANLTQMPVENSSHNTDKVCVKLVGSS